MAVSNSVPPSGQAMATIYSYMEIEGRGRVAAEGVGGMVVMRQVTPGYFGVLGVPLRKGRGFREEDRDQAEAKTILDEALALRMFGAENPVGKRIKSGNTGWMEVVGVAANVRNAGLERAADPEFYMVKRHRAEDGRQSNTLLLRGPEGIVPAIREEFRQMDPRLTVEVGLMDGAVSRLRARPRFQTVLLGGFAAAGLFLAGIGLYGVMALLVAQRRREIGVRMALGAAPGAVRRMVLGQAGVWLALGGAIGLAGAWWGRQTLAGVLFEARSSQLAPVLAASVGLLLVVGLASAWAPAARASRVDPAQALRADDGA